MGRLKELRKYVNQQLEKMSDPEERIKAAAHLYGVSLAATMISEKRHQNTELASMAAMLHDLYAYENGTYEDHAHRGAVLAEEILKKLALTDEEETKTIDAQVTSFPFRSPYPSASTPSTMQNQEARAVELQIKG